MVESKDIATKMGWLSKAARSQNRVYNPRLITRGCLLGITPSRLPTILWPDSPLVILAAVRQAEKVSSSNPLLVLHPPPPPPPPPPNPPPPFTPSDQRLQITCLAVEEFPLARR